MLCVEELAVLLCWTALYFLTQRCSSTSDIFFTKGWFHCRAVRPGCNILLLCLPRICPWCRCLCLRQLQAVSKILNSSSLLSNNCYHLLYSQAKSLRLEKKEKKEKGRRDGSTLSCDSADEVQELHTAKRRAWIIDWSSVTAKLQSQVCRTWASFLLGLQLVGNYAFRATKLYSWVMKRQSGSLTGGLYSGTLWG